MDLQLSGKVAAITGASKGIGLAITKALVTEGVLVGAGARETSTELDELAAGGSVTIIEGDLTTSAGSTQLIDRTVETFGRLNILVNNIGGVRPRLQGFLQVSDKDFLWSLNINYLAAVRTTRAALPHLLRNAPSSIVTISSLNASLPDPGVIDYSAAKAALSNFCKSLSKEVGPQGVRVNTISPGPVKTALWLGTDGVAATIGRANGVAPETVATQAVAGAATGRFTRPEEVADLVVMLASPNAGNITGTNVIIDGGLTSTL